MLDAWLNLSHRENAREFVMVRASAMAVITTSALNTSPHTSVVFFPCLLGLEAPCAKLTNKRQPDKHEPHEGQYRQRDPQERLDVVGQPEEAAVCGVDGLGAWLAALKHPLGVARGRVDLVPPPEPDEPAAGYVFQVIEVAREEEDGDDEYEDAEFRRAICVSDLVKSGRAHGRALVRGGWIEGWGGRAYRFSVKRRPKR